MLLLSIPGANVHVGGPVNPTRAPGTTTSTDYRCLQHARLFRFTRWWRGLGRLAGNRGPGHLLSWTSTCRSTLTRGGRSPIALVRSSSMGVRSCLNPISLSNRFSSFLSRCCFRFSCLLGGMLKAEALHGLLGLRNSSSPPQQSAGKPPQVRGPGTGHLHPREPGPTGCSHSPRQQPHHGSQTHNPLAGRRLQNLRTRTWLLGLRSPPPLPQYRVPLVEEQTPLQLPACPDHSCLRKSLPGHLHCSKCHHLPRSRENIETRRSWTCRGPWWRTCG